MSRREALRKVLTEFQEATIAFATGHQDEVSYKKWEGARNEVMAQPELVARLPKWVVANRWGSQFWSFIKSESKTYDGRRRFVWASLGPVFEFIERGATEPTARALEPLLGRVSAESVAEAWSKAQARRESDPEGVITAARSLLESVCKFILEEMGEAFEDSDDLPQLYRRVATAMKLSPADHPEQVFKQILSGCVSVVGGLAALRNAFGDAHGKGRRAAKPSSRHADLALNLAGSLATFLIATYETRKGK